MKISITFQTTTLDSRSDGDISDSGFIVEDVMCDDLEDVLGLVEAHIGYRGYLESSNSGPVDSDTYWSTTEADQDIYSGEDTFYSVHIDDATDDQRIAINEALTAK